MVSRTPTTEPIITPSTIEEWQEIAATLASEVTRLHEEIDRLKGGEHKAPIVSKADWTHPLYPLWIELGLDSVETLQSFYFSVWRSVCPKCEGHIPVETASGGTACEECQIVWYASDGHFALDTIERAQDRGPDA